MLHAWLKRVCDSRSHHNKTTKDKWHKWRKDGRPSHPRLLRHSVILCFIPRSQVSFVKPPNCLWLRSHTVLLCHKRTLPRVSDYSVKFFFAQNRIITSLLSGALFLHFQFSQYRCHPWFFRFLAQETPLQSLVKTLCLSAFREHWSSTCSRLPESILRRCLGSIFHFSLQLQHQRGHLRCYSHRVSLS